VKSGKVSAKYAFHRADQFLVKRIARPPKQPLGGRPEMGEVVDNLGLAGCA
jgi:hypothetical protein